MLSKPAASSIQGTFKHFLKGMQATAAAQVVVKKIFVQIESAMRYYKNCAIDSINNLFG